ncbi:RNA polymerase sigma factor [Solitalea koreensis]|uniref:RNA polymerase sigma-70 factor, ECF subfamily n=1 Tax=Solitalea koreensis TaxID=543615 RepID=A0A521CAG0_9SPHI|nr:sigma-70 family RNA polymerase sigma factor [Solitalea koreensis]SMO56462.1 RNA polymerase sigma-70 factor, ECF subfamily [Solitalea koreensis]
MNLPKELNDRELMVHENEEAAFHVIFDRYWKPLFHKALNRTGNDADAQDVVQEVFISCWNNRATIQIENSLAPYLFTALKYAIIKSVYRKAKKGIHLPLDVEELNLIELSSEEIVQAKELQDIISQQVSELPERMQEIYRLSRVENLQIAQIAQHLNLSEQTVKNTLTTALGRLRKNLSHYSCWLPFFL